MDREEAGQGATNWKCGVYPTRETARRAQEAGWLYVKEDGRGRHLREHDPQSRAAALLPDADWQVAAAPENVLVLHTLCVDPACAGRGIGREVVRFALSHARETGMRAVRWTPSRATPRRGRCTRGWGSTSRGAPTCCTRA